MPDYIVTGPDGRQLRFTGPEAPSQTMIEQGFQKLPDPQQAWQKAQGIGPAKVGERYLPTGGPMGILDVIRTALGGAQRPPSVAAQDPYGIQAWEKGAGPMPTPIMAETQAVGPGITAYHGSPYDFEKFDLGKIGTGEGAQAYGHGLYFAEKEGVAKGYRDTLAQQHWSDRATGEAVFDHLAENGILVNNKIPIGPNQTLVGKDELADGFVSGRYNIFDFPPATQKAVAKRLPQGKMYQVSIAAHPDQFLDWDKPLSQQSESVRTLATQIGIQGDPTGQELYQSLAHDLQGETMKPGMRHLPISDAKALVADRLRSNGVSGIKYLDQGSRAAGEGSRNFVVFDDSLISIMKKYGIALPFFAGMSRLAQRQPQGQTQ